MEGYLGRGKSEEKITCWWDEKAKNCWFLGHQRTLTKISISYEIAEGVQNTKNFKSQFWTKAISLTISGSCSGGRSEEKERRRWKKKIVEVFNLEKDEICTRSARKT